MSHNGHSVGQKQGDQQKIDIQGKLGILDRRHLEHATEPRQVAHEIAEEFEIARASRLINHNH